MVTLAALLLSLAAPIDDLPIIDPDVAVYQQSSHNKRGLNGDGGFFLYSEATGEPGLAGWVEIDEGAHAIHAADTTHSGRGAMIHKIDDEGLDTGWRSIAKPLSEGLNVSDCDAISLWVWPSYTDGGREYGIRIDSGGRATELPIEGLTAGQWNHVIVDIADVPREAVGQFWLIFNQSWGYEDGMTFLVDDVEFRGPDGASVVVDDFETGPSWHAVMDAMGPGCLRNMWSLGNGDIRIEVDGQVLVEAEQIDLFEGRVPGFSPPLVHRELVATGPAQCITHWSFQPVPFRERCRILTRSAMPFNHYIFEKYRDPRDASPHGARDAEERYRQWFTEMGTDPKAWDYTGSAEGHVSMVPGEGVELARIPGPAAIGQLEMDMTSTSDEVLQGVRLRIYWDGEPTPSVDAPIGHLFAVGNSWRSAQSLMAGVRGATGYCYFPMPFWERAVIRLENLSGEPIEGFQWRIAWADEVYPRDDTGYFRTWFHRDPHTPIGEDHLFLDVPGRGQLVGVVQTLIGGHYCEGDIRFHMDGSRTPQLYGTGSEDYYHSACWPNIDQDTPFHGCVGDVQAIAEERGVSAYDVRACYYRFHLEAPVRFQNGIQASIEHGGVNNTDSSYTSLAFYYSQDDPGVAATDVVVIGDPESEMAHALGARDATRYSLEGYFEGDHDDVPWAFDGLAVEGPLTVELAIDPENEGVRLRRVLDQLQPRQRASVYVDGVYAGEWYDPDQNEWKRLAESDFEIPKALTRGRDRITVGLRPHPASPPWTVLELRAMCYLEDLPPRPDLRLRNTPPVR
ncbi:MAG: DUF2961 domain-containing protein [Armatimonadia bacterium]|nr:DUF2961 domain-containing protein [Armatimonadia bacterium]